MADDDEIKMKEDDESSLTFENEGDQYEIPINEWLGIYATELWLRNDSQELSLPGSPDKDSH